MATSPKSIVHVFEESLEFSVLLSDESAWVEFYQRIWPEMTAAVLLNQNGQGQRDGNDRAIHLRSGRVVLIDEKKRRPRADGTAYEDILLEDWSVWYASGDRRNKIGWALDENKRCDFVAYANPPAGKCYLLPFELLRVAFTVNRSAWERLPTPNGRVRDAQNQGYVTRNIAVPWPTLRDAIVQQMHRKFGSELQLPMPKVLGDQINFNWA